MQIREHNGFTFNGVGSSTVLDNLVSYMGGDDAFEWFGGTVDASNLLAYGAKDDLFDWTYGWVGSVDNILGIQSSDVGDRGIEGDNSSKNRTATPFSNPTIKKAIIIGNNKGSSDAVKLREGTKAKFSNLFIKSFKGYAISVEHDETLNNVIKGELTIKYNSEGMTKKVNYKQTPSN